MKISVVVPVYNVEKYLSKCVNSIRKQSYHDLEIVLVDDGAEDSSGKICDEFAKMDRRIKVIHKENGGLSDARNAGLAVSTGEYICFIDSDDWIEPDTLLTAVRMMDEADIVVWGYFVDKVDEYENVLSSSSHSKDIMISKPEGYYYLLQPDVLGQAGYAWNKLYRTRQLLEYDWQFEKGLSLIEDTVFNYPLFLKCERIRFINYIGTHYIQRGRTTLGTAYYPNRMELKLRVAELMKTLLINYGAPHHIAQSEYEQYVASSFRSTIRSIAQLEEPYKEKKLKISLLLANKDVKRVISKYHAIRIIDKIVMLLAKLKWIDVLIVIEGRKR